MGTSTPRKLHGGLAGLVLALAFWICTPLMAQTAPAAGGDAKVFEKGALPPDAAAQVQTIVLAQVKACLPPAEAGTVALIRVEKDTLLAATVDGQAYTGVVFRTFGAEVAALGEYSPKEFYVRTKMPWKLKSGLIIPGGIYLVGTPDQVSALDSSSVNATFALIVCSDDLCKAALDQLKALAPPQPGREAAVRAVFERHRKSILSGEKMTEQRMRSDYEAVLGAPLVLTPDVVVNGDFKNSKDGIPVGWKYFSYTPSRSSVRLVEDDQFPGRNCFLIEHMDLNDSHLSQSVTLQPGAVYELTARIKTEAIRNQRNSGAFVWIEGDVTRRWLSGRFVTGTRDWRQFQVEIVTPAIIKPDSHFVLECRVGDYGDGASGKAWFADVKLKRLR